MTSATLLSEIRESGVELFPEGDHLRYQAPKGSMTPKLRQVLQIEPNREHSANLYYALGTALTRLGRTRDAIRHLEQSIQLREDRYAPPNALAWILAIDPNDALLNPPHAVELAGRTAELTQHNDPDVLDTLTCLTPNYQFESILRIWDCLKSYPVCAGIQLTSKSVGSYLTQCHFCPKVQRKPGMCD